jgi:cell division protein FtsI/penicillin-binding protein 2
MRKMLSNLYNRDNFGWRVLILIVFILLLFGVIFFRLFQIQVVRHDFYKALAQDQHEFFEKTVPKRGEIFARNKYSDRLYPLAVNDELNLVYAVPRDIENKREVSQKLSEVLGMDEETVFNIISKENDPYEVVKHRVDDDLAEKVKKQNILGVDVIPEIVRYYPGDYLAANIVGFLGYDSNKRVGQYGVEGYYNSRLEGKMGFLELEKDATGSWISIGLKSVHLPEDGDDIILTIDQTIQYIAEKKLKEAVEKYKAEGGNIIIISPKSGEIMAMAQYPSYNLNEYFKEKDMSVFLNSGIHSVYEPGSIQKPITMAIGIDLGKISPSTTYLDKGFVEVGGWKIRNSDGKAHGKQNMVQVLEKSLNTGSVFVQEKVDKSDFYDYLRRFGLNELTGIDIAGEVKGNLSNLDTKRDINYATASYGQGISVTPLAILTAISSFANDGKLMKPYVVGEFVHADGSSEKVEPKIVRQVVSPRTASLVSAMMVSVVENGHARRARVKGYKFAGKTGTAQVPRKEGRGYEKDKTIHTFIGFGPLPNPKFSILVKLDSPQNVLYAADTAAPVFQDLAQELVNYYNIPPTEDL